MLPRQDVTYTKYYRDKMLTILSVLYENEP